MEDEAERGALVCLSGLQYKISAVSQCNLSRQVQANTRTCGLGGNEGMEYLVTKIIWYAFAIISDEDADVAIRAGTRLPTSCFCSDWLAASARISSITPFPFCGP